MQRRTLLKTAALGLVTLGTAGRALAAKLYFPTQTDHSLFETINRAANPKVKTTLEMLHVPVILAPETVKVGEPFTVEVSVGETLHPMEEAHWIEYIELNVGNQPAGRINQPANGFLQPKVAFTVVLDKAAAKHGKLSLIARERCNLHGYWEGSRTVTVA